MITLTICGAIMTLMTVAMAARTRKPNLVEKRVNRSLRRVAESGIPTAVPAMTHVLHHDDLLRLRAPLAA